MSQPRPDGDKARQALILSAEPIGDPGPHAGTGKGIRTRVQLKHGAAVSDTVSHHRSDHAKVINTGSHFWKQVADFDAALTVAPECPRRLHQVSHISFSEG